MNDSEERLMFYYDKIVRFIKDVIDDEILSSEAKIRLLGMIL